MPGHYPNLLLAVREGLTEKVTPGLTWDMASRPVGRAPGMGRGPGVKTPHTPRGRRRLSLRIAHVALMSPCLLPSYIPSFLLCFPISCSEGQRASRLGALCSTCTQPWRLRQPRGCAPSPDGPLPAYGASLERCRQGNLAMSSSLSISSAHILSIFEDGTHLSVRLKL